MKVNLAEVHLRSMSLAPWQIAILQGALAHWRSLQEFRVEALARLAGADKMAEDANKAKNAFREALLARDAADKAQRASARLKRVETALGLLEGRTRGALEEWGVLA